MKRQIALAGIIILFLIAAWTAVFAQEEAKPAPKAEPKLRNWYKIEITLNEFQDGKKTNTRSYTMEADDDSLARVRLGDRVPIATGGPARAEEEKLLNVQFQYLDVGLEITCHVRDRQGRTALSVYVEQSGVAIPPEPLQVAPRQPIIRRLSMDNTTFVTLGQPMLISSVDDPGKANHKYTVEALVTKLNP